MAYVDATAADLKTRYPAFADVDDAVVNQALVEARRMVDTSWTEGDYQTAQLLYACHIMAIEGYGTSPDAQANTGQAANFTTIRSGQLTLTRKASGGGSSGGESWYMQTRYGSRFWMLLGQNRGGGRVAAAEVAYPSYAAKDWPLFPWGYP